MKLILIFIIGIIGFNSSAQVLKEYIEYGLEHNLGLKQEESDYRKSLLVMKEAKSYFYPSVSLNARYSAATGGRTIEFPIGDLLNPVYQNLTSLYQLHGIPTGEPIVLENEEFPFLRPTEQETKLRLIQPLFNSDIYFNNKIQKELSQAQLANLDLYKRELVAEIKTSYYNYLKSVQYLEVLENAKLLLNENLRVNESLYKNDKVTIDYVYKSKTELSKLESEFAEANKTQILAQAYFNFLLNKAFDSEIDTSSIPQVISDLPELTGLKVKAMETRQEILLIDNYFASANYKLKMEKMNLAPNLNMVVDYGVQGEKYRFTNDDDYAMASLILSWDIFKGFQNTSKTQQTELDLEKLDLKRKEVEQQIYMQVTKAYYEVISAQSQLNASADEETTANKSFELVNKKYLNGQCNLLEYIDAQNTKTLASKKRLLAQYNLYQSLIELEKVSGIELLYE